MSDLTCFKCGNPGHPRSQCPQGTRSQASTQALAVAAPSRGNLGVPPRKPDDQIADAHTWANRIRADNPALFGHQTCGDRADVIDSPIRRALGLHPIHQCVLRQMAAAQLEGESR